MSRKVLGDAPGKKTATTSRGGRIGAILGVLSAMVRGGNAKSRAPLAGGVPQGVRPGVPQVVTVPGGDLRLVR